MQSELTKNNVVKTTMKRVYGKITIYPDNECVNAKLFIKLIGQKTFSEDHIAVIQQLGYTIQNNIGL